LNSVADSSEVVDPRLGLLLLRLGQPGARLGADFPAGVVELLLDAIVFCFGVKGRI